MKTPQIYELLRQLYAAEYAALKQALEIHGGCFDFSGFDAASRSIAYNDAEGRRGNALVNFAGFGEGPYPDYYGILLDTTGGTLYLDPSPNFDGPLPGELARLVKLVPQSVKSVDDGWKELDGEHEVPWNDPRPVKAHIRFDSAGRKISAWTENRSVNNYAEGANADRLVRMYLEETAGGLDTSEAVRHVFADLDLPF